MRLVWTIGVLSALTVTIYGTTPSSVSLKSGEDLPVRVTTLGKTLKQCYLTTPNADTIELYPEDQSTERYEILASNAMSNCVVTIKGVDADDIGIWNIRATFTDDTDASVSYDLAVDGVQSGATLEIPEDTDNNDNGEDDEVDEEHLVNDGITWLKEINYVTKTNATVDISLSKLDFEEKCFLYSPDGEYNNTKNIDIENVIVGSSSQYVSCRVTIGPMNEILIGNWTLCGEYSDENGDHKRCQTIHISWRNAEWPDANWQVTTRPFHAHVVHLGGILSPVVVGTGSVDTCHIITPDGEDLVLTEVSQYPGLTLVSNTERCSIEIGPIDRNHLANWTLYGRFDAFDGYNEVHLPFSMALYDEEDPYNQAYNRTELEPQQHVVNIGNTIEVEVTGTGELDNCYFETSSGDKNLSNDATFVQKTSACLLRIGPITEEMLGDWLLVGKFSNRNTYDERRLSFTIIKEDPANPIEDDSRVVYDLAERRVATDIGKSLGFSIELRTLNFRDSCHLRTPEGLQYSLIEGFNVPGVFILENTGCGVTIEVTEDTIGNWVLISRESNSFSSVRIEQRAPIVIVVEETVKAAHETAHVTEGSDLHLRLRNPTSLYSTCQLTSPSNTDSYEVDPEYTDYCGYIVRNITALDAGLWQIVYGTKILYKAPTTVTVQVKSDVNITDQTWTRNEPVSVTLGPSDAIYCKIEDPIGNIIFEEFGSCVLELNQVKPEHEGLWKVLIGLSGQIVTEEYTFTITVNEREPKSEVVSTASMNGDHLVLSCAVNSPYALKSCKFLDPEGNVLLVSQGVGWGRYSFYGNGSSFESGMYSHDCGLRVAEPVTEEFGRWRCSIVTEEETYYGFPSMVTASNAVEEIHPVLPHMNSVTILEGEALTLSCSVMRPIQYCYFRARNGTVFSPTESAGAGLDAGECGVSFSAMSPTDSGAWSCHVGFETGEAESSANIQVHVTQKLSITQSLSGGYLVIEARAYDSQALDYCRFVRVDGLGFTTTNPPSGYLTSGSLEKGECSLRVNSPSWLDLHHWAVAAKITGQTEEVSVVTSTSFDEYWNLTGNYLNVNLLWILLALIGVSVLLVGVLMIPTRNRQWASARASSINNSIRNSFRRSFTKKAAQNTPTAITAEAA